MTAQPLNSEPALGPVEGRGVAEIRADLARRRELAARPGYSPELDDVDDRLALDVEPLLAEVEAAHRFERSEAVEREALLCEVERLREDLAYAIADAKRWHDGWQELGRIYAADVDALRVERDSLRGVVQAVEAERDALRSNVIDVIASFYDGAISNMNEFIRQLRAALAAAADAPQPEDEPTKCAACGRPKNAHSPTRTGGYLTGHRFIDPKDVCHHTIEEGCTGHGDF